MFEQAAIAVQDEKTYAALHSLIDAKFAASDVEVFLDRVTRSKLRVRDFEACLIADCWVRKRSRCTRRFRCPTRD